VSIVLGADTLCWHLRLESGDISLPEVIDDAVALGCGCIQLNLHHARALEAEALTALGKRCRELGLAALASGDFLGEGRSGDTAEVGVRRIRRWLEQAVALGSPLLRVVSGFYRTDLAGRSDLIEAERRYVVEVLRRGAAEAEAAGVRLLLENHSDFTADEYASIVEEVGVGRCGVFLDLVNPVAALDAPGPVVARLAPLAHAGHVKDYVFRSIPTDDGYHRRGFEVLYCYPGEGVADLPALVKALHDGIGERQFFLSVEGLDNRPDVRDQTRRLSASLAVLRELIQ
jgi:sugar phosphate isomerase/epimerase